MSNLNQIDRDELAQIIHESDCGCSDGLDESEDDAYHRHADAVIAYLSTVPVEGGTVEIGGQVLTQAQYDAARFPLMGREPHTVEGDVEWGIRYANGHVLSDDYNDDPFTEGVARDELRGEASTASLVSRTVGSWVEVQS